MRSLFGMTLAVLAVAFLRLLFSPTAGGARAAESHATASSTATTQESGMGADVKHEVADFGSGCFWGTEAVFRKIPGVIDVAVGYEGGSLKNPTYRDVCTDETGHAEVVHIVFDPAKITYQQLVDVFFEHHDPTTLNSQGPDFGTQYRSVIFYHTPEQKRIAEADKARRDQSGDYVGKIVTQIVPAQTFYRAEEYHQNYFEKHGMDTTCHLGNGKKATAGR